MKRAASILFLAFAFAFTAAAGSPSVIVLPDRTATVSWNYTNQTSNTQFEVWCNTNSTPPFAHWGGTGIIPSLVCDPWNFSTNWFLLATTTNLSISFPANLASATFLVRAKDQTTGKTSGWATR